MNNKKRKDKKGRILKTGESQRKDFVYQYRYIDFHGKGRPFMHRLCRNFVRKKRKYKSKLMMGWIMKLDKSL